MAKRPRKSAAKKAPKKAAQKSVSSEEAASPIQQARALLSQGLTAEDIVREHPELADVIDAAQMGLDIKPSGAPKRPPRKEGGARVGSASATMAPTPPPQI